MIKFNDFPEGAKESVRLVAKEMVITLDEASDHCASIGAEIVAVMVSGEEVTIGGFSLSVEGDGR